MHRGIMHAAEIVRESILKKNGKGVLPECYTGRCTCDFIDSLRRDLPKNLLSTAIYTRADGLVDWRYCITGDCECDYEVVGTHIGLAFNPAAYSIVAVRLAKAQTPR
jgi:hypothetical protein